MTNRKYRISVYKIKMRWFQILLQAVKLIHHKDIIKRMLTTKSNLYKKTKIPKLSWKNYKKILFKDFPNLNIKIVQEYKNKTLIGSSGRLIRQKEQKENEFLNWLLFNLLYLYFLLFLVLIIVKTNIVKIALYFVLN
jgi:uncharacterized protein YbcV (DUF1398 family)